MSGSLASSLVSAMISDCPTFVVSLSSPAMGASLTAVPVMDLMPVTGGATPSLTLVAMVKLPLKLAAGVKFSPASSAFTSAMAPLAVQTPLVAL